MLAIHVGLPKTGTTFLQQSVFPNLPGIHYPGHGNRIELEGLQREKDILLSHEDLSGVMVGAGEPQDVFRESMAGLYGLFPQARIILGIRSADDLLASMYRHYKIWHEPSLSLNDFLDPNGGQSLYPETGLLMYPRIRAIEEIFGHEPLVYTTREFKENFSGFLGDLLNFLEIDAKADELKIDPQPVRQSSGSTTLRRIEKIAFLRALGLGSLYSILAEGITRLPDTSSFSLPAEYIQFLKDFTANDRTQVQKYLESTRLYPPAPSIVPSS